MAYRKGIVYVMEIPRWKGVVKIGRTRNSQTLEDRRRSLEYQHGVKFEVKSTFQTSNAPKTERAVHKDLKAQRVRKRRGREFFKVTTRTADSTIRRNSASKRSPVRWRR